MMKGNVGFGGLFRRFTNNCYFFFPLNAEFFNGITEYTEYKECISIMDDLFQRMLSTLGSLFEEAEELSMLPIQIMMMPYSYGKKIDKTGTLFVDGRNYAYSDSSWMNGKIIIRYVPICDSIFNALQEAKDRSAEVDIFLEIMHPLNTYFPELWKKIIEKAALIKKEKKEISVTVFQIDYKWNREEEQHYSVSNDAFILVRKHIAKVCFDAGITPGTYYGKEATNVVRTIQQKLITDFEDEISKYDYLKVFENALSVYATSLHDVMVHRKRYENIGEIKLDVKTEVSKEIIKQREEEKHYVRVSSYLLETGLFLGKRGKEILSNEKMQYLLAYANWLVVLSDDADKCYFTEKEVRLEVTNEYIINVEINIGSKENEIKGLSKRLYDNPGYFDRDYEEDHRFFEETKKKFKEDTGIELELLTSFLYYLETGGNNNKQLSFRNNVLCFWKDDILRDFCLIGKTTDSKAKQILDFVSIKADKLKTKNGKSDYYLPIGEKEKRDNRFEVKPVYEFDDMLIYSPIVIHYLREYWQNSLMNFCMPYEIGLPETKKTLDEWKRVYEKKIVFDLEEVFKRNGFLTRHNFELRKLDKKKYPQHLGDYDVFAVNPKDKEIWIVECKVLEKVETFYEMYRQQNRFFNEEKSDEKFQSRIDYLRANYKEVIKDLKLPQTEYCIKPIMCINKVFLSRYKDVDFPILSYQELVELINNQ